MNWFERKIRRYEHRRWTTDDNRRVQPFHWGLEHIGGSSDEPDPGAFVRQYAQNAIESSPDWYAATPADDYPSTAKRPHLHQFLESPWPENNTVHAQLFPAGRPSKAPRSSFFPTGMPNGTARTASATGFSAWASLSLK